MGGTNFTRLELLRSDLTRQQLYEPLSYIGHDAEEMLGMVNKIIDEGQDIKTKQIIISGGIKSFLQGYYLINKCKLPSIYGQASTFLQYAKEDYELIKQFIDYQVKGLSLAYAFLRVKESKSDVK